MDHKKAILCFANTIYSAYTCHWSFGQLALTSNCIRLQWIALAVQRAGDPSCRYSLTPLLPFTPWSPQLDLVVTENRSPQYPSTQSGYLHLRHVSAWLFTICYFFIRSKTWYTYMQVYIIKNLPTNYVKCWQIFGQFMCRNISALDVCKLSSCWPHKNSW